MTTTMHMVALPPIIITNTKGITVPTIMVTPAMNRKRIIIPTENLNMEAMVSQKGTCLRVAADDMFLPVVMAFVEQSSLALGLGKPKPSR